MKNENDFYQPRTKKKKRFSFFLRFFYFYFFESQRFENCRGKIEQGRKDRRVGLAILDNEKVTPWNMDVIPNNRYHDQPAKDFMKTE